MSQRKGASIINLSSVDTLMGLDAVQHYSPAKGGILAVSRAVARDVAPRGIRMKAICPGYSDTLNGAPELRAGEHRHPDQRRHRLGHAATALVLACSDGSYFTGQWLSPNGRLRMG